MFKRLLSLTFLLLIFSSAWAQRPTAEDYQIYSLLINTYTQRPDSIKQVRHVSIVRNLYMGGEPRSLAEDIQSDIPPFSFNRMKEKPDSATRKLLVGFPDSLYAGKLKRAGFNTGLTIHMIGKVPVRRKHIQQDWDTFYKKYPASGGVYGFSGIYYSADRKTAIVYQWKRCQGLCGSGDIIVLEKKENSWRIKYSLNLWMS